MRTLFHPAIEDIELSQVFYALSEPIRMNIVLQLMSIPEQTCGGFELSLSKSTMSHHFKVLREAGIIRTRMEGTQRFICLRKDELEARFPGLMQVVLTQAKEMTS
ncbi:helix-turn-helix domain-containing protein [Paenibacillaceae sp. P-4]|uniref:ArsR/SmtB family transcription factor n=1 Tax=Paenibacillaceae bacterium P-4 TaxID=3160969 RepID=UPI0032E81136